MASDVRAAGKFVSDSVGSFIDVSIDGLEELEENLLKLPEDLAQRALGIAARRAMAIMQERVADSAPIRTGKLSKGIKMRSRFNGLGVEGGEIVVSVGLQLKPQAESVFYGMFVEFGTVKMKPEPYMKPAFDSSVSLVLNEFGKQLGDAIERVARRAKVKL